MFPTLNNNAAARYKGPMKIELLKGAAGLLPKVDRLFREISVWTASSFCISTVEPKYLAKRKAPLVHSSLQQYSVFLFSIFLFSWWSRPQKTEHRCKLLLGFIHVEIKPFYFSTSTTLHFNNEA